jgi:hypothetical protein
MDIEHLTKSQIVLLSLLCTFVASIATGIVTVSLLAQAPPAVTQTVNHIIQRTVETVAPSTATTPATTIKETTVVVKEDELLSTTITASFSKIGIVHQGIGTSTPVVALAVPVGNILLTDASAVTEEHVVEFGDTLAYYKVSLKLSEVGVAVLTLTDGKAPSAFRVADVAQTKLGQSVVALPSGSGTRVGIGAVTGRYTLGRLGEGESEAAVRAIDTNIGGSVTVGAPLFNVFGDLLGISTSVSQGPAGGAGTFVSVSDIAPFFSNVKGTSTAPVAEVVKLIN